MFKSGGWGDHSQYRGWSTRAGKRVERGKEKIKRYLLIVELTDLIGCGDRVSDIVVSDRKIRRGCIGRPCLLRLALLRFTDVFSVNGRHKPPPSKRLQLALLRS